MVSSPFLCTLWLKDRPDQLTIHSVLLAQREAIPTTDHQLMVYTIQNYTNSPSKTYFKEIHAMAQRLLIERSK